MSNANKRPTTASPTPLTVPHQSTTTVKRNTKVSTTVPQSTTKRNTKVLPAVPQSTSKRNTKVLPTVPQSTTKRNTKVSKAIDEDTILDGELSMPEIDEGERQIAYGKFMRAMLEDCLVDQKIQREETDIDVQLCLLAKRFNETIDHLDETNQRLKEVSFVVEQKRLYDLKNKECTKFFDMIENSKANEIVDNITKKEKKVLSKLETKNVDLGYKEESGHKQLLDVVNAAITGLKDIKKQSDLDPSKFNLHKAANKKLIQLETNEEDINQMKQEFENRFPKFNEALMKEASEHITKKMNNDIVKGNNAVNDDDADSSSSSDT